jgi:hypothetical protein
MPFVIQKKDDPELFVANFLTVGAYYGTLEQATIYPTRERAERNKLEEQEIIREVEIKYVLAD